MKKLKIVFAVLLLIPLTVGLAGCDIYDTSSDESFILSIQSDQDVGITVTGVGEVEVIPDIAFVNIGVQVLMKTLSEAQQQAAQSIADVMDVLENHSIAEQDIQTSRYDIQQVWEWINGENTFVGYKVINVVSVKIRDMDAIGDIIDDAVSAGGEYIVINGITFSVDSPEDYYAEARLAAMEKAKENATQLAHSAGVKVGKPISIYESSYYSIGKPGGQYAESDGRVPTSISAGELTVSVTVQVVYTIA
ncbi:MAG TPA: SIMPL domain-containing protein [Dehalococcoidia bacterium]|nr:SIMPL domain-containing protein [Dehalococcoidia bacterium]